MAKRSTTNRPRASRNAYAGYHRFQNEDGEDYGSFLVRYLDGVEARQTNAEMDEHDTPYRAGWYWAAGFPGCMPDGDPSGPYTSSQAAFRNARNED